MNESMCSLVFQMLFYFGWKDGKGKKKLNILWVYYNSCSLFRKQHWYEQADLGSINHGKGTWVLKLNNTFNWKKK